MSEEMLFQEENNKNSLTSAKNEIFDWIQNITVILTVVILLFMFVFRIVGVDGESMLPTLQHKDWLVISNLFYEPKNEDIVVVSKESFLDGKMIVKRVIATENQTVDIDFQRGIVYVDGVALDEPYINDKTKRQFDMQFPAKVPKDCVFVLGDNRNHSSDSRDARLGMVHKSNIHGKVILRIFPLAGFGKVS